MTGDDMNCGIYCIIGLLKACRIEDYGIIVDAYNSLTEEGLNCFSVTEIFRKHGYQLRAYRSIKPPKRYPYIMIYPKGGHYVLVEKKEKGFIYLDDSINGRKRIFFIFFPFIFSKYYLMML